MPDLPIQMSTAVPDAQAATPAGGDTPAAGAEAFAALLQSQLAPAVALEAEDGAKGTAADVDGIAGADAPVDVDGLLVALLAAPAAAQPVAGTAEPGVGEAVMPAAGAHQPRAAAQTVSLPIAANPEAAADKPTAQAPAVSPSPATPDALLAVAEKASRVSQAEPSAPAQPGAAPAVAAHAPPAANAPTPAQIAAPLGSPQWGAALAERVVWMIGRDTGRADFVLNPPHLGRVEISLSLTGDTASAVFVSPAREVRDAIEQALPRLREALAQAGIALGQADVHAGSAREDASDDRRPRARADAIDTAPALRRVRTLHGLVDTFA